MFDLGFTYVKTVKQVLTLWNQWQGLGTGWTQPPCTSGDALSLKLKWVPIFPHEKATAYLRQICPGSLTASQKCTYLIPGECFKEVYLLKMYAKDFQKADKL